MQVRSQQWTQEESKHNRPRTFRETKVGQDEMASLVEKDVLGLEVSIDNLAAQNGHQRRDGDGRYRTIALTPAACSP
jgi:hypothetical protein